MLEIVDLIAMVSVKAIGKMMVVRMTVEMKDAKMAI